MIFGVAFIVGAFVGAAAGFPVPGILGAGVLGIVAAFIGQFVVGYTLMRRGQAYEPVDLESMAPEPFDTDRYRLLPLAQRNGIIATAIANAADVEPALVAPLLAGMMGRERMSNLASQRGSADILSRVARERIDRSRYQVILEGEVQIASEAAQPPNDRARAIAEGSLGEAVTPALMRTAILTTRFTLLDRVSVAELIDGAMAGDVDLAFAVGSIRKVGEKHQQEMARL